MVDRAGNERSTQSLSNGDPASRTLPLRIATRLDRRQAAADPGSRRQGQAALPHGAAGQPAHAATAARSRSSGRLTMPGGNPLAGADVEVWERVKLPVGGLAPGQRAPHFANRSLPVQGAPGSQPHAAIPLSRHRDDPLALHRGRPRRPRDVPPSARAAVASSTARRSVSTVASEGARPARPASSCYLQVYTRGRWSTFATPRAEPAPAACGASPTGSARRAVSCATGSAC